MDLHNAIVTAREYDVRIRKMSRSGHKPSWNYLVVRPVEISRANVQRWNPGLMLVEMARWQVNSAVHLLTHDLKPSLYRSDDTVHSVPIAVFQQVLTRFSSNDVS